MQYTYNLTQGQTFLPLFLSYSLSLSPALANDALQTRQPASQGFQSWDNPIYLGP